MPLCVACEGVCIEELNKFDRWDERLPYQHLPNAQNLPSSARKCPLCALILASIYQDYQTTNVKTIIKYEDEALESQNFRNDQVLLSGKESQVSLYPEVLQALTGLHVEVPAASGGHYYGILRLYTKPENRAKDSQNITTIAPLPSHCCDDAFALLNSWLNECISKHECCRETFSGECLGDNLEPKLPTRVLEVSNGQGAHVLRLVETKGMHGHYAALSHCWGPPSRHPLTTTKETLKERLEGISWKSLSKTFQDAVTVAREIGLCYLWIDSLCIIQNDDDDWISEASRMGSIYEQSQLTIAAAGAADGSMGCFMERPALPAAVELLKGGGGGSFSVALKAMKSDTHPDYSPLNERAWITQEWLLPRRMLYYTKGQMVWSCKKKSHGEDYESLRLVARITANKLHWLDLVGNYCCRKMTYDKDKLNALQGIASAWQKLTGDQWAHGIWTKELLKYLFWRAPQESTFDQRPVRPGVLAIPSWSWASTQGEIWFDNIDTTDQFCSDIKIENSGYLFVRSRIKPVAGFDGPVSAQAPGSGYHILGENQKPIGIAYFDDFDIPKGMVCCAPLVKIGHGSKPDPLNPGWFKVLLVQQSASSEPGLQTRVGIGDVDELSWFDDVPEVQIYIP